MTTDAQIRREILIRERANERTFRDQAPRFVGAFEILGVLHFRPGGEGCYASATVITRRSDDYHPFTVHTLIRADESGVSFSLSNGEYLPTLSAALDYAARELELSRL